MGWLDAPWLSLIEQIMATPIGSFGNPTSPNATQYAPTAPVPQGSDQNCFAGLLQDYRTNLLHPSQPGGPATEACTPPLHRPHSASTPIWNMCCNTVAALLQHGCTMLGNSKSLGSGDPAAEDTNFLSLHLLLLLPASPGSRKTRPASPNGSGLPSSCLLPHRKTKQKHNT